MRSSLTIFLSRHWDALLAAVAAAVFIYFFTRHSGIGISPDSVTYQATADNIRHHFSFTDFNGRPMVDFPLGYPCFLALASLLTGINILQLLPVVNMLLFGSLIILCSIVINRYREKSSLYKTLVLAALAMSPCLLEVYSMLWSETVFLFCTVLFAVVFGKYFRSQKTKDLFIAALIAALACVTRYAGITLLATGGFLLLFNGSVSLRKKTGLLFLFMGTGLLPVLANLIRNHYAAGHVTGVREKAIRGLADNLQQIGATLADWLPFLNGHETVAAILFILILLWGVYQLLYRTIQQPYFASYETIILCFFVVYAFFMIVVATVSRFENLTSRLLSPMYIPLLLTASSWINGTVKHSFGLKKKTLLILFLFVYSAFQYNQYRLNAAAWEGIKDAGIPGYTENPWMQSATLLFVKKNKAGFTKTVYSNANDAVYFLSGVHALALPHKEIAEEKKQLLQQQSFCLIWLNDGENPDLVGLDFIKQHKKLDSLQQLEDGFVYFFSDTGSRLTK